MWGILLGRAQYVCMYVLVKPKANIDKCRGVDAEGILMAFKVIEC